MLILLMTSVAISLFLLIAALIVMLGSPDPVDARLMEIAAPEKPIADTDLALSIKDVPRTELARAAAGITDLFKPLKDMISGSDGDLAQRLTLGGFPKAGHIEVFTAMKMLLPVIGVIAGTFISGGNMLIGVMGGGLLGFFGPDLVLSNFITRRQQSIRQALPDALDLLVICMEAGLGIDKIGRAD